MTAATAQLRRALAEAGLESASGAILSLTRPAIRLRALLDHDAPRPHALGAGHQPCGRCLRLSPAPLPGHHGNAAAVAVGWHHILVLQADGSLLAWGENDHGQLGDGTTMPRLAPVPVVGLDDRVIAIAAGDLHSLALTADGRVLAWGSHRRGGLGIGDGADQSTPVGIATLGSRVKAIAAGGDLGLALMSDGSVRSWGGTWSSSDRPLADGGRAARRDVPGPVLGLSGPVSAISTSGDHCLALQVDGRLFAWGSNHIGKLGDGTTDYRSGPVEVPVPPGLVGIAAGGNCSMAVVDDGSVLLWPATDDRMFATSAAPGAVPTKLGGLPGRVACLAAGGPQRLVAMADGSVLGWGGNPDGVVGDGTRDFRATPVPVAIPSPVLAVAASSFHSVALTRDGAVWLWGGKYLKWEHDCDATIPAGRTKMGGRPDLAPGVRWPSFRGAPQQFIAQIDLAEVAPLSPGGPLPATGLLTFFAALDVSGSEPDEAGSGTVIYTDAGRAISRAAFPDGLPSFARMPAARLCLEREIALPSIVSLELDSVGMNRDQQSSYGGFIDELDNSQEPIHRLLGFESPVQTAERQQVLCQLASNGVRCSYRGDDENPRTAELLRGATEWRLLLQIDSDMALDLTWGDMGRLYWWIRASDLVGGRFDRTWLIFQSH